MTRDEFMNLVHMHLVLGSISQVLLVGFLIVCYHRTRHPSLLLMLIANCSGLIYAGFGEAMGQPGVVQARAWVLLQWGFAFFAFEVIAGLIGSIWLFMTFVNLFQAHKQTRAIESP